MRRASVTEVVEVAQVSSDLSAFTAAELASPGTRLAEGRAARIAAKRAVLGAAALLGAAVHDGPDALLGIEVVGGAGTAPRLLVAPGLLPEGAVAHVSLGHDGGLATALVLVELPC